jgi:hypothetical protein
MASNLLTHPCSVASKTAHGLAISWPSKPISFTRVQKRSMLPLNRASCRHGQWEIRGLIEQATDEFVDGTAERIAQVRMTINVKRSYGFYIWKVFLPLLMMVAISWTVFG